jgi:hypothetical protein
VMAKARQQLRFKLGLQVEGEQHDWPCSYKVMAGFAGCTCGCAPVLFVHMVRLSHCMLGLGLTSTPHWTSGGMFFWDLNAGFPPDTLSMTDGSCSKTSCSQWLCCLVCSRAEDLRTTFLCFAGFGSREVRDSFIGATHLSLLQSVASAGSGVSCRGLCSAP